MTDAELRYASADILAADAIPVIDFGRFIKGDAAMRADVAAQIATACERVGFFYVINHGVPEPLRAAVLQEARDFFARPVEQKMACAPIADGRWCGYLPGRGAAEGTRPGGSLTAEGQAATSVSGGTLQQYTMMRVLMADDANYGNPDLLYQPNAWPDAQPRFAETMIVHQRALLTLGAHLMRAFALALDLDEGHFLQWHRSPLATFGLNYYPRPLAGAASADIGVGAHCDASSFTVLLQDDVGGLEVQTRDGRWIAAPVVPGAYVINIGDTMMGWTNGHFVSTLHRVVNRRHIDRFSATMFMNPDREVEIAPIGKFVTAENPSRYAPFANEDYMRRFFVKFYDSMFK